MKLHLKQAAQVGTKTEQPLAEPKCIRMEISWQAKVVVIRVCFSNHPGLADELKEDIKKGPIMWFTGHIFLRVFAGGTFCHCVGTIRMKPIWPSPSAN